MSDFISWLTSLDGHSTKVRAVLRRSLAFDPGTYSPAFAYVETFVGSTSNEWRRKVYYLVAALWAIRGESGSMSFARVLAEHDQRQHKRTGGKQHGQPSSTERRFVALLDSDQDQLAYRMRQMISLLKDSAFDWNTLLKDLLYWNTQSKSTQIKWAREFYGQISVDPIYNGNETPQ